MADPGYRPRRRGKVRPSVQPVASESVVDELFRHLKLEQPARAYRALRAFQKILGPRIQARARGEALRGATLYVRVSSSAWAQELHTLKAALLEKLQATPGGETVADLRFTVGPLDEMPGWDLAPPLDARPPKPSQPAATLPPELASAVAEVKDDDLRAELHTLLRWGVR